MTMEHALFRIFGNFHRITWAALRDGVISERRRAEEVPRLRQSERELAAIIDSIPAQAWAASPDGAAEFFNQRYLDYVGLTNDDLKGSGWVQVIHPDDLAAALAGWARIMASARSGETEARFRRFDGEYRWCLVRAKPRRDDAGRIVRWYGINVDIDDRKCAEEALRRSEGFLAAGQRISLTGSFSWRFDSDEVIFSDELRRIFEFGPDMPATLKAIADRVHPDDTLILHAMRADARLTGSDHDYEIRLVMPGGTVKHVHVVSHRAQADDGVYEYLGAIQDVTQRRMQEAALGDLRTELERISRIASLGSLTASIAHEVNQPLAGVVTNAATCLRMLAATPPDLDGAAETLNRTIRDGHRAADVITRVRALFSKKAAMRTEVNLNDAAREVITLAHGTLTRSRVQLQADYAADLPTVVGDRTQLQQVVLNLVLNACEAMEAVEGRTRSLGVWTDVDAEGRVRLSVKDAGTGFGGAEPSKSFNPFHSTKEGGMGIGLSISRSIVERHEGVIGAAANDDHGATFWFCLPCAP
jgi:PAS domain S-box-containing protein